MSSTDSMFPIIPDRFKGRHAVVTGAGSGIGRATALRFAAEGARVALLDRSTTALEAVAAEIEQLGGECLQLLADCTVEEDIEKAFDTTVEEFGGLDALIANAGVELPDVDDHIHDLTLDGWNTLISNNLTGQFLSCKHAARRMRGAERGTIVCLGSNLGHLGMAYDEPAYSASKGGVFAMARAMAIDYARQGIRVNIVIPGFIDTPMNSFVMADPDQLEYWSDLVPMGRPGSAHEVASAILWLSSDEASYCIGTALVVDGGQSSV